METESFETAIFPLAVAKNEQLQSMWADTFTKHFLMYLILLIVRYATHVQTI
jgi:hypothetical protein